MENKIFQPGCFSMGIKKKMKKIYFSQGALQLV